MNRRQLLVFSLYFFVSACGISRPPSKPKKRLNVKDDEPSPKGTVKFPKVNNKSQPELDEEYDFDSEKIQPSSQKEPSSNALLKDLNLALTVGHGKNKGGFEVGARNGDVVEYELNKRQSDTIKKYLEDRGAKVRIFHYDESSPSIALTERGANTANFDIHVSLHHNAYSDPSVQGGETLVGGKNLTAKDKILAKYIQDSTISKTGFYNRGIKEVNLAVLRGTPKNVVKCLTEPFFITHSDMDGTEALKKSKEAAIGIAQGIEGFWLAEKEAKISSIEIPSTAPNDLPGLYDDHVNDSK